MAEFHGILAPVKKLIFGELCTAQWSFLSDKNVYVYINVCMKDA